MNSDSSGDVVSRYVVGAVAALLGIYLMVVFLPWVLIYGVFPALGSMGLGWFWFRAIQHPQGGSQPERLAFVIPMSALVIGIVFFLIKPSSMSDVSSAESESITLKLIRSVQQKNGKAHRLQSDRNGSDSGLETDLADQDSWNSALSQKQRQWDEIVLPFPKIRSWLGIESGMSFRYEHGWFVLALIFCAGAPGVFFFFFKKSWIKREKDLYDVHSKTANVLRQQLSEQVQSLSEEKKKNQEFKDRAVRTMNSLNAEVARLKKREKYLSEGRPMKIEGQIEKPDLNFL
jgi:hypothetical protein